MEKLIQLFEKGGPVMWPILLLSVLGLAILIANGFALARGRKLKGMGLVSSIITAEPMLGILGTVTGIIQTFGALQADASASPIAATAGIGEALITTAGGLVAALLLLFPYNYLASKGEA